MRDPALFQDARQLSGLVETLQPCWPILFDEMRSALLLMQMAYRNIDGSSAEHNPKNTVHGGRR
jgi:hypothetical protein